MSKRAFLTDKEKSLLKLWLSFVDEEDASNFLLSGEDVKKAIKIRWYPGTNRIDFHSNFLVLNKEAVKIIKKFLEEKKKRNLKKFYSVLS